MSLVKSFAVGNGDMFYIRHNSDSFSIIDCCLSDDCVFRSKPITDSGPNRSLIPVQTDHRFRSKPITLRRS